MGNSWESKTPYHNSEEAKKLLNRYGFKDQRGVREAIIKATGKDKAK